ncbi:hypothetical protein [Streptomyces sp. RFCAC02]|uniref:hypothetical protein n=1 Tax=Streptomyces sp. RFCAC02 TaxID=2499143 RepID=UPI00143DEC4D|nr:hypothetical protein [Streptomyces sp. RFCAC02]
MDEPKDESTHPRNGRTDGVGVYLGAQEGDLPPKRTDSCRPESTEQVSAAPHAHD